MFDDLVLRLMKRKPVTLVPPLTREQALYVSSLVGAKSIFEVRPNSFLPGNSLEDLQWHLNHYNEELYNDYRINSGSR